jgi:hypothetical protein
MSTWPTWLSVCVAVIAIVVSVSERSAGDPFSIHQAEQIIERIHLEWGEAIGNYVLSRVLVRPNGGSDTTEARSGLCSSM